MISVLVGAETVTLLATCLIISCVTQLFGKNWILSAFRHGEPLFICYPSVRIQLVLNTSINPEESICHPVPFRCVTGVQVSSTV